MTGAFAGLTYFEIRPDGAVRAVLVDDDGLTRELIALGANEAFGMVSDPTWSPDGSMLAFGGGPVAVTTWVVDADGSDPRRLPPTGPTGGSFVAWSPDSRSILVREALDVQPAGWTPRHWIVDVLTEEVREVDLPEVTQWLPDGSFLGVRRDASGSGGPIVVVSIDGEETALSLVGDKPRLSPAGDRIAFEQWTPTSPSEPAVVVANRDGSDERVVGPGSWPAWSRDGSQLAYLEPAEEGGGRGRIAVATAGGERIGVFDVPLPVAWGPDGSLVATRTAPGGTQLVLIEPGTGEVVGLTAGGYPTWRPGTTQ